MWRKIWLWGALSRKKRREKHGESGSGGGSSSSSSWGTMTEPSWGCGGFETTAGEHDRANLPCIYGSDILSAGRDARSEAQTREQTHDAHRRAGRSTGGLLRRSAGKSSRNDCTWHHSCRSRDARYEQDFMHLLLLGIKNREIKALNNNEDIQKRPSKWNFSS